MDLYFGKKWQLKVNYGFISYKIYIYIYAFSRRFYPKRLTVHSGYTFFISMCVPWELNPQPFALLTQCSTTESQDQNKSNTHPCSRCVCALWMGQMQSTKYLATCHVTSLSLSNEQLFTLQDVNWWTGVTWITCRLLWCFYQLFGLIDPLVSKWCNV